MEFCTDTHIYGSQKMNPDFDDPLTFHVAQGLPTQGLGSHKGLPKQITQGKNIFLQ